MDRLSIFLTLATGSVITGGLVTGVLALGLYNWVAIGAAAVVGFLTAWPSAFIVSRRIKRRDPEFNEADDPLRYGPIPPRDADEI